MFNKDKSLMQNLLDAGFILDESVQRLRKDKMQIGLHTIIAVDEDIQDNAEQVYDEIIVSYNSFHEMKIQ